MSDATPLLITGLHQGPVEIEALPTTAGCGAESCFVGRTRAETHDQHGPLVRLDYEAYAAMVEPMLERLAAETAKRFGAAAVRMVHAVGPVAVGEASVLIQVATPHRAEAFEACRYAIDTLKRELPIWKREVWEGGETFAPGTAVDTTEAAR